MFGNPSPLSLLWTSSHTKIAISYVLFLIIATLLVYNVRVVHPIWLAIILGIATWYFITLLNYSKKWMPLNEKTFKKKLFWFSLGYRIGVSLLLIAVAQITWDQPHYVGAVDARTNYREALILVEYFKNFEFLKAYHTAISFSGLVDNIGPPLIIGLIFSVFGSHYFIGSLFYCIINAFGVVFLYKTAKIIWGENIARTAGIMYMHFPLALFFSVVFLKEGVVAFLILYITYSLTKSINGQKLTSIQFLLLIASMASLFFFRTAVGALFAILVPSAFIINRYRGSRIKSILIGVFAIIVFGFIIYAMDEYHFFMSRIYSSETVAVGRTAELGIGDEDIGGLSLKSLSLAPIYVVMSVIAPFPGLVAIATFHGTPHDHSYYFLVGEIIWNILAFFSIIGFYYSIKKNFFQSFVVWAFTAGYLYILVATVLFTRVRFAYLGMPLMLALVAVGLANTRKKTHWILYLIAVTIMTLIWNYLRLSVRGL